MNSILIVSLALLGLGISSYLLKTKLRHERLVCFLGDEDCDAVVKSKYGYLFKIPNELLGVLYYFCMIAGILLAVPFALLQFAAVLALTSSLILVFVQAFVLKKWCEWCLATAVINLLLFFFVI